MIFGGPRAPGAAKPPTGARPGTRRSATERSGSRSSQPRSTTGTRSARPVPGRHPGTGAGSKGTGRVLPPDSDPHRSAASRARVAAAKAGPAAAKAGSAAAKAGSAARTIRVSSNPRAAATHQAAPHHPVSRTGNRPKGREQTARTARTARTGGGTSMPAGEGLSRQAAGLAVATARAVGDYFTRTAPQKRSQQPVPESVNRARTGRRLVITLVALALVFGLIVYKLTDLQVLNAGSYAAFGESQRIRTESLAADRGAILDRNGTPLALSTPLNSVFVDPKVVRDAVDQDHLDLHAEAGRVAEALGLDVRDVEEKMQADNRFGYLARQVPPEQAAKIKALKAFKDPKDPKAKAVDLLPGIEMVAEPKRFVPSGDLAKSIVGQVDIDGNGISGLEKMYGDELTGTPGKLVLERDPAGRTIAPAEPQLIPAVKGHDVQLTIDRSLQFDTERILSDQVRDAGAKAGIAVVMKPDTGEVLAMANVVGDQKTGKVSIDGNNAALTTVYEPGSVMKLVTASGAIENGKVQPDTVIGLTDTIQICDAQFSEHDYHGNVGWPVSKIISQSSNIGTIKLGQMIGKDEIYRYMRGFGFGERSAVNFPNEQAGTLAEPDKWWCSSNGSIPIGQGVSVTPLQMLNSYNVIANGGVYVAPKLVAATIDGDGNRHPTPTDEGRRVVSRDTANKMNIMLRGVVEEGTGTAAAIAGYNPAGKTGTARKPQPGGGYMGPDGVTHYEATFVGFVPAENPALSIIVIIDDPSKEGIFGGVVAAPAFSKIGETALRQFAVPPPSVDLAAGGAPADQSKNDPAVIGTTTTTNPDGTTGPSVTRTSDGRVRGPAAGTDTTLPATAGVTGGSTASGGTAGGGTSATTRPPVTYPGQQVPATVAKVTPTTTAPATRYPTTTLPPKRP